MIVWTPVAVVQPGDRVMWWNGVLEIRSIEERDKTYWMEAHGSWPRSEGTTNRWWRCKKTDELMVIT